MKIKAFDFYPNIVINVSSSRAEQSLTYHRKIKVSGSNSYNDPSLLPLADFTLELNCLDQERNINPSLYVMYGLLPLITVFLLVFINKQNKHKEEEEDDEPRKERRMNKRQIPAAVSFIITLIVDLG